MQLKELSEAAETLSYGSGVASRSLKHPEHEARIVQSRSGTFSGIHSLTKSVYVFSSVRGVMRLFQAKRL